MPSARTFSLQLYNLDRVVVDWYQLSTTFTQSVPLKVSNAYESGLYFQGQLDSPPARYTAYSGINLGLIAANSNRPLIMTWDVSDSGQTSRVTDSLSLTVTAYTSSNYTGSYNSQSITFSNVHFNRESHIKVFGDGYNNTAPTLTLLAVSGTGSMSSGAIYNYCTSFIMSGWESDVGAFASAQITSGLNTIQLTWTAVGQQTCIWRYSGADLSGIDTGFAVYSGTGANVGTYGTLRPIELLTVTTSASYVDGGGAGTLMYRHRTWQNIEANAQTTTSTTKYLSPSSSRTLTNPPSTFSLNTFAAHAYQLGRNISGTLTGPWYITLHRFILNSAESGIGNIWFATADGWVSGINLIDSETTSGTNGIWVRYCFELPARNLSGYCHIQLGVNRNAVASNIEDVYITAIS